MSQTKNYFYLIKENINLITQDFMTAIIVTRSIVTNLRPQIRQLVKSLPALPIVKPLMWSELSQVVVAFSMKARGRVQHLNIASKLF